MKTLLFLALAVCAVRASVNFALFKMTVVSKIGVLGWLIKPEAQMSNATRLAKKFVTNAGLAILFGIVLSMLIS